MANRHLLPTPNCTTQTINRFSGHGETRELRRRSQPIPTHPHNAGMTTRDLESDDSLPRSHHGRGKSVSIGERVDDRPLGERRGRRRHDRPPGRSLQSAPSVEQADSPPTAARSGSTSTGVMERPAPAPHDDSWVNRFGGGSHIRRGADRVTSLPSVASCISVWMCRRTGSWSGCCVPMSRCPDTERVFHDEESVRRLVRPGRDRRRSCGPVTRRARPAMSCTDC